jgi:hypothetical protein
MSQIRYFVHHHETGWAVRRDAKSLGAFVAEADAAAAAAERAAIDRARGHDVQMLKLDEDGRWSPFGPRPS